MKKICNSCKWFWDDSLRGARSCHCAKPYRSTGKSYCLAYDPVETKAQRDERERIREYEAFQDEWN